MSTEPTKIKPAAIQRSRKTCFNCRMKRKKCDMVKPVCTRCAKSRSKECVWPENGESVMPKKFVAPKMSQFPIILCNYNPEQERFSKAETFPETLSTTHNKDKENSNDIELYNRGYYGQTNRFFFPLALPIDKIKMDDPMFLNCFPEIMNSTSPQYSHPSLSGSNVFKEFLAPNEIAKNVNLAVGCQYLSWKYSGLGPMAVKSYKQSKKTLYDYIQQRGQNLFESPADSWLLTTTMILLVSDLMKETIDKLIVVNNLLVIYFMLKKKVSCTKALLASKFIPDKGNTIHDMGADLMHLRLLMFDKYITESFIFHYGSLIFVCNDYRRLPRPIQVFNDFNEVLTNKFFDCEVSWRNNPILGAATKSFEIHTKVTYLFRLSIDEPNSDSIMKAAELLIEEINGHQTEHIPYDVILNDYQNFKKLDNSVLTSNLFLQSSMILLRKILMPLINESDESIQDYVHESMTILKNMTYLSRNKMIIGLPLFIIGCCCIHGEDKNLIIGQINEIGQLTHSYRTSGIIRALQSAWLVDPISGATLGVNALITKSILDGITP